MDWLIRDVLVLAFHPRYVYRIFFHSMVMATCIFPLFFAGGNNITSGNNGRIFRGRGGVPPLRGTKMDG